MALKLNHLRAVNMRQLWVSVELVSANGLTIRSQPFNVNGTTWPVLKCLALDWQHLCRQCTVYGKITHYDDDH